MCLVILQLFKNYATISYINIRFCIDIRTLWDNWKLVFVIIVQVMLHARYFHFEHNLSTTRGPPIGNHWSEYKHNIVSVYTAFIVISTKATKAKALFRQTETVSLSLLLSSSLSPSFCIFISILDGFIIIVYHYVGRSTNLVYNNFKRFHCWKVPRVYIYLYIDAFVLYLNFNTITILYIEHAAIATKLGILLSVRPARKSSSLLWCFINFNSSAPRMSRLAVVHREPF